MMGAEGSVVLSEPRGWGFGMTLEATDDLASSRFSMTRVPSWGN
jgi:hypothetical protein